MNKLKRYLENHHGATIEDYNNQRHRMHIIQASTVFVGKHTGSKSKKKLLTAIPHCLNLLTKLMNYGK